MSGTYKEVSGWEGGKVGGERGWVAGGRLKLPLRLFGLAMSPRSTNHRPKHALRV